MPYCPKFRWKYPKTPLFVFIKRGPLYFFRKMAEKSNLLKIFKGRTLTNFPKSLQFPWKCYNFCENFQRGYPLKIYAKTIFKMSENIHRGDSYLFSENLAKEMYQIGRFVFVIQMNYQTSWNLSFNNSFLFWHFGHSSHKY